MKLKELREKRAGLAKKMHDIHDKAEGENRGFSDDEKSEFGQARDEHSALEERIKVAEEVEQSARDSEIIADDVEQENRRRHEQTRKTHEDDPNRPLDSGERSRVLRTWANNGEGATELDHKLQARSGLVASGNKVEMVFHRGFDEHGEPFEQPRTETEANEQYRARRESEKQQQETRAQALSPNTAGGFTVPNAMMRAIDIAMLWYGGMLEVAESITTDTGAMLPMPSTNDTNQEGEWVAEGVEVSDQDVAFASVDLTAHLCSSKFVGVSYQLMQDSATQMATLLGRMLGERCGRTENKGFTIGDAVGKPRGIMLDTVDSGVTTASNAVLNFKELIDLKYSVDKAYRSQGAGYMMHDQTLKIVKKMEDANGKPLYLPSLYQDGPETFNGDPITVNNDMPTGAAAKAITYGMHRKYIARRVRVFEVMRLNELLARFHQVAFMGYTRVDGRLLDAGVGPVKHLTTAA